MFFIPLAQAAVYIAGEKIIVNKGTNLDLDMTKSFVIRDDNGEKQVEWDPSVQEWMFKSRTDKKEHYFIMQKNTLYFRN